MKQAPVMLVLLAAAVHVASWFWAGDEVAAVARRLGNARRGPRPVSAAARVWNRDISLQHGGILPNVTMHLSPTPARRARVG